ncbi:MAG: hypothetical protein ACHQQQ_13600 [Bacteroidota bacterium]
MNCGKYIVICILLWVETVSHVFPQSIKASRWVDLIPPLPVSVAEARERISPQDEDIKVEGILSGIHLSSDTTQPLTIDDTTETREQPILSSGRDAAYDSLIRILEHEWLSVDDSINTLVQIPKLNFQNAIVTIGERRVKAVEACKRASHSKKISRWRTDSLCIAVAEVEAALKRDSAANGYLKSTQADWNRCLKTVKSFLIRQEERLDSMRTRTIVTTADTRAKKIEATLVAVVKLMLQMEGEITKFAAEAGAR